MAYDVCRGPSVALHLMQSCGLVEVLDVHFQVRDRGWALVAPKCRPSAEQWPRPRPTLLRALKHATREPAAIDSLIRVALLREARTLNG